MNFINKFISLKFLIVYILNIFKEKARASDDEGIIFTLKVK